MNTQKITKINWFFTGFVCLFLSIINQAQANDTGVEQTDNSSITLYVNTSDWADLHYSLNGASQQNIRMPVIDGRNLFNLTGLSNGDSVDYWFTYLQASGGATTTLPMTYVVGTNIGGADSALIEAEDYDNYYDTDEGNNGSAYRNDDVDIQTTNDTDGNFNVGWTAAGEWLEYSLNLNPGTYTVTTRVASQNGGGNYSLSLAGIAFASDSVAATGSWQTFETHNLGQVAVTTSGAQTLRLDVTSGNFNLNWLQFTLSNTGPLDSDNDGVTDDIDQCPNTPANTTVNSLGCAILVTTQVLVEAEDYSDFFDTSAGNNGNAYRNDDVDIQTTDDSSGSFNVGWTAAGEWLEYDVTLGIGTYNVTTRVASDVGGGDYSLSINGNIVTNDTVADTGSWQSFENHTLGQVTVTSEGSNTVRIDIASGNFNLNWLQFSLTDGTANDSDNDGVTDVIDQCPNTPAGVSVDSVGCAISLGNIVPLYDANTLLEQPISFDRGDALVTRFADRGRDRHAKEDQFQIYDHYLSHYWTHRTAQFEFVDYVAKGGSSIEVNFITEWKLGAREFRAWYVGLNTVAEYHGNYFGGNAVVEIDNGSYDFNFNKISDVGDQYRYRVIIDDYRPLNWSAAIDGFLPLQIGQRMEIEVSQFLDAPPEGRENYYGTTYLYIVGQGLVPWKTVGDFDVKTSEREDSYPIAEAGWLGGGTTLPYNYTNEPDNHFMQMATNLSNVNGQTFVEGRRVHHSNFIDGQHDELSGENGVFNDVIGKAGTHYINTSCASCHERNGRAAPPVLGESLDKWVFKVGDVTGNADPLMGKVLQPNNLGINDATQGEGDVSIASWTENNGLRSPNYQFTKGTPAQFSARIAPQLVGLGLLEAIPESSILAMEDVNDSNGDGISGKAQRQIDPTTGDTRLGRFGFKAGAVSIEHQVAAALNTDIGVMTSVLPNPDCGAQQTTCDVSGAELSDQHLQTLVKYIALLGVRAQRNLDDPQVQQGQGVFSSIGCNSCHTDTLQTSAYHPLSELRDQTIHPYTDLLLHDMGPGLADNLAEGQASGAEWRTTPLWGLGLSACVTGGVDNILGGQGNEFCTPEHSYLHDGRARTIEEAILWHGGEADTARIAYEGLSTSNKAALLSFLNSL